MYREIVDKHDVLEPQQFYHPITGKLEEDVDATALYAVGTLTTRIPIWVNGTAYWLYLDPV